MCIKASCQKINTMKINLSSNRAVCVNNAVKKQYTGFITVCINWEPWNRNNSSDLMFEEDTHEIITGKRLKLCVCLYVCVCVWVCVGLFRGMRGLTRSLP